MPSLKTTLLMDTEPYDAALVRSRAAAAVAGQDIQRKLAIKISAMQESIARMPQGAARMAAEEKLSGDKIRLATLTQRAITELEISEYQRRGRAVDVLAKQNAYLLRKAQIFGSAGSGVAPGFTAAIKNEAELVASAEMEARLTALSSKQNAYLLRKAQIMGTTGSGMAPGFAKLLATEGAMAAEGLNAAGNAVSNLHGRVPGLNLVLRETLVIFREIGRGNWARVPGSLTLVVQGLRQMRDQLGPLGALFTLTGAVVVGSVAAIVASFFIWEHRVKSLAKALEDLKAPEIAPPDISRLTAVEKGWIKIKDAIRDAVAEAHSANEAFERAHALLDEAQSTERRLMDIRKQKDMDLAGNDPAKKAAVRAKYLKEEHDTEFKQQQAQLALLREKAEQLREERDTKKAAAAAMEVETEEDEKTHQEILDKKAKEGTEKRKDKKGNEIDSQLEEDKKTVEALSERAKQHRYDPTSGTDWGEQGLGEDDQARLTAAQDWLGAHDRAVKAKAAYDLAKKDRDEARKEQARLYAEAAKAGADSEKGKADYAAAAKLDKRILADNDAIRGATADEKDTKESLHVKSSLNAQQRIGAYSAAPGQHKIESMLEAIKNNTAHLNPPAHPSVGHTRAHFGGPHQ